MAKLQHDRSNHGYAEPQSKPYYPQFGSSFSTPYLGSLMYKPWYVQIEGAKDAEITVLKKKAEDVVVKGFKDGEAAYIQQCEAAKDLFFKCGWRGAVEQLGCGPDTEVYNAPQYFIPASLAEYAASVQQQFLQGSDDEDEENFTPVVNEQGNDQSARLEPTVEDLTVEPPTDIVLPVATETDLPFATGVQVDIEADLEDLFN